MVVAPYAKECLGCHNHTFHPSLRQGDMGGIYRNGNGRARRGAGGGAGSGEAGAVVRRGWCRTGRQRPLVVRLGRGGGVGVAGSWAASVARVSRTTRTAGLRSPPRRLLNTGERVVPAGTASLLVATARSTPACWPWPSWASTRRAGNGRAPRSHWPAPRPSPQPSSSGSRLRPPASRCGPTPWRGWTSAGPPSASTWSRRPRSSSR